MTGKPASYILLVALLSTVGCYKRTPLGTTPSPSMRVVATLSDSGIVTMANALGAGPTEVEGVVTKADADEWTLELLRVDHRDGRSLDWNHEAVAFPRRILMDPFVVVLDKKRSWLAAAGIVVGAFAVARAFNLLGADENKDGTEPPPASLVPVLPGGRE